VTPDLTIAAACVLTVESDGEGGGYGGGWDHAHVLLPLVECDVCHGNVSCKQQHI